MSGKKKEHKLNLFLSRYLPVGGGGSSTRGGGGQKIRHVPRNPGKNKFFGWDISRGCVFAMISRGRPKSPRKTICVHFLFLKIMKRVSAIMAIPPMGLSQGVMAFSEVQSWRLKTIHEQIPTMGPQNDCTHVCYDLGIHFPITQDI